MPAPEIELFPGGFVTSKARHLLGPKGASPFITAPSTIEGFKNLICYYGETAYPLLNSTGDTMQHPLVRNLLGNDSSTGQDVVDMTHQDLLSRVLEVTATDGLNQYILNNNGEFTVALTDAAASANMSVASELFTTAGTVTVTAGSKTVVGVGTGFAAATLAGGYGIANPNVNLVVPGDIILVANGGRFIPFRIIKVTDATHLDIWPTPTAGNPALGAGLAYQIFRTGYNSYSNMFATAAAPNYVYYVGNCYHGRFAGTYPHGTIECVAFNTAGTSLWTHYMSPRTVDSAGAPVAELMADDLVYFKGFILYGAGPAISWSVAGAPSALPFGPTDFPAKNVTVVDVTSKFVSFEQLGDQVVALFEDSSYLVSPTGTVPEFTFYKMPELLGILDPVVAEPSGMLPDSFNHGRHSTSGRGTIYYVSNRGLEAMGGGLAMEVSAPISTALRAQFGKAPLYIGWNVGDDTVLMRDIKYVDQPKALVYNPNTQEWSSLLYGSPNDTQVLALTPGVTPKTRNDDHTRLQHYAYYDSLVGPNGGQVYTVAALMDENTPTQGLVPWQWITTVVPAGLQYPDFSFGGFVFDAYSLNSLPVTVTWTIYGGSSPYNLFSRDSGTMSMQGGLASPWVSTRQRLGKKIDDPFFMFVMSSTYWVAPVRIKLFDSSTEVMR